MPMPMPTPTPTQTPATAQRTLAHALALALGGAALITAARVVDAAPAPNGANIAITNCNDSGPGSLRAAMASVTNNSSIDFDQLTCSTITLTTGALTDPNVDSLKLLATPHVVAGRPVPAVTIDGNGNGRVIDHESGGELELQGLALRNGRTSDAKGGGCVYSAGHVRTTATSVSGCVATAVGTGNALGGGIASNDAIELHFSTVSGNSAQANAGGYAYGGGVFTRYGLYAAYSTISGNSSIGFGYGGGASVLGYATIHSSVVSGNAASYGAGLALFGGSVGPGDLMIANSTIAQNHATGFAAGIEASGPLEVFSSTIAGNFGDHPNNAAGIVIEGANTLQLVSSIVANNTQAGVAHDIGGPASISGSANLVGASTVALPPGTLSGNPMLAALADNGGQTLTMRLLPGSPAIDAGGNPTLTPCDQRAGSYLPGGAFTARFLRTNGNATDIGAFESGTGDSVFYSGFERPFALLCHPI
jgi:hypothetical protein